MSTFKFFSDEPASPPAENVVSSSGVGVQHDETEAPTLSVLNLAEILPVTVEYCETVSIGEGATLRKVRQSEPPAESDLHGVAQTSDLLPGKYEGGFKVWECSVDLLRYLYKGPTAPALGKGVRVLELGCGHGLPGVYAAMSGAYVDFVDFNKEVLECCTVPNVLINAPPHPASGAPPDDCSTSLPANNHEGAPKRAREAYGLSENENTDFDDCKKEDAESESPRDTPAYETRGRRKRARVLNPQENYDETTKCDVSTKNGGSNQRANGGNYQEDCEARTRGGESEKKRTGVGESEEANDSDSDSDGDSDSGSESLVCSFMGSGESDDELQITEPPPNVGFLYGNWEGLKTLLQRRASEYASEAKSRSMTPRRGQILENAQSSSRKEETPTEGKQHGKEENKLGQQDACAPPLCYDVILSADTVYSLESLPGLARTIKDVLAPAGVALIAAKRYYFGVGGGVSAFVQQAEKAGLACSVRESFTDGSSNVRDILAVQHRSEI